LDKRKVQGGDKQPVMANGDFTAQGNRALWVVGFGSFLSSISTSIVGVILPKLGSAWQLNTVEVSWTMMLPLIVISVGLLPVGRTGDLIGHRRVYLGGLILVGVTGFGCAIAPSYGLFLVARGIQGLGAAALMASSPALVSMLASPNRRGHALGFISTATYLGLTAGPPLGGFLEYLFGWQAVFWFQGPLAVVLFAVTFSHLPEAGGKTEGREVDWLGVILLTLGLTSLLLAFGRNANSDWRLGGLGILSMSAFFAWQLRAKAPLLDLRLFKNRMFASASLGALLNYLAIFHSSFLMPFFLEDLLGMPPGKAGLYLIPMPLVMAMTAFPSGKLSDKWGSRWLSAFGLGVSALALFGLGFFPQGTSLVVLVILLCTLGFGSGVFVSPNTNSLMSSAPADRQGTAGGIMALARNLGMLGGTSISAALYASGHASGVAAGLSEIAAGMALPVPGFTHDIALRLVLTDDTPWLQAKAVRPRPGPTQTDD